MVFLYITFVGFPFYVSLDINSIEKEKSIKSMCTSFTIYIYKKKDFFDIPAIKTPLNFLFFFSLN